ncbi:carboxylesterase 4A-like [Leguminivora glycinivorella]|uniref:carboxylesterase 4A-like n=1 Tax=Leguminivora glycinivorella TaxID=1035111 RepID=UPI00200EAF33|nr:carboxylesterase 4A-like [Leguminivora glycinivorella]
MKAFIWLNILFVVNVYGALQRVDPLVLIGQGLVKGIKASDSDYSKFLGIPYAKVDLNNPFGAAQAAPEFEEEIFQAYDNSRICPQTNYGGVKFSGNSENESPDCLQLNVYSPSKASTLSPLPVLVWIHGGIFIGGSANEYNVPDLVKQGIVVVTVNYRLGPYGFMCLDDPAVPGNQGLKDQYAALQWVRNNIAAFGGNPYNVTLAGQSAGSASVLLQLYSSKEKLFNKVIAQSGTPLSPSFFVTGDSDVAIKLANYLGLNTTDNQQALEFLASSHHSLVTGASADLKIGFKPCKEKSFSGVDNFIDSEPYAFSNERKIRNTPILIGNTDQEVDDIRINLMNGDDFYNQDFFYASLKGKFNLENGQLQEIAEIVRHFYIGDTTISEEVKIEAAEFLSDYEFNHPIQDTITNLIKDNANPVYEYVFTYTGDSGEGGAPHSAELEYLFDFQQNYRSRSEADQIVADRIVTLWANFIKYGNPTPETSDLIPVKWSPVTETTRPYLNIGADLRMEDRFLRERLAFWELFQSVYGKYSSLARQCDY